ncbi:hypothetical protein PFICI_13522 [Pestalotiopsis fici W106-1]|uniref:Phytocyanin domain-containing protein n=1 Tax=Pestalotiopsis fici (strain W106-1 / CGMCC3.15140) TaxID=1229662 RepID=W3WMD7_PESFW|nr:uncharacterized protein PFICI_13522 [Pestalotiopsis fici W106-1]ETS75038.1 hypothetical protein PFICI_13522 [Pestalotiopsis fici W106-1]
MQSILKSVFLAAVAVSALPQPFPQDVASATDPAAVMTPEEAAAQALRAFMPSGFSVRANQIIPVVVGGPQDTFVPNVVTAAVGDVVQFQFSNGNHTVTQSAQDVGCQPLQASVATAIHSGHIPFVDGQTTVGTFSMPVTSTDPMFLYCATGPHCQEGQVIVINPANVQQVVDYAKISQASSQSGDGTNVVGGTVAQIPLDLAAFTPAPAQAAAPPAAEAPAAAPAADPAATSAAAAAPPAASAITLTIPPAAPAATDAAAAGSSTTTIFVTVPAPA